MRRRSQRTYRSGRPVLTATATPIADFLPVLLEPDERLVVELLARGADLG
jgi:hypothetical protein